jgi:hypothetical protein
MRYVVLAPLFAFAVASLSGCEKFYPDLEGPLGIGSWIHKMPVKKAVQQIQCELSSFIRANQSLLAERAIRLQDAQIKGSPIEGKSDARACRKANGSLVLAKQDEKDKTKWVVAPDPNEKGVLKCFPSDPVYADVQIYLQQDTMGNVTYLGIDLNKLGLEPVAQLISVSNKAPSLSISGQATASVKSQLDLQVPQADLHPNGDNEFGKTCSGDSGSVLSGGDNLISSLGLKAHLENFFSLNYRRDNEDPKSRVCMTKLTLQTQFAILLDAKAGLNPLGSAYILPISGLSVEIQPKFIHSLQITLYLEPEGNRVCPTSKTSAAPMPRI